MLSVSRANGVELTSDYETSARETIRLGDIVSSPLIVSDGGNTVNFSFENVINTQAARLKSQQILDAVNGTVLGDAINNEFNFPRGQAFSIPLCNILIINILYFSTHPK